MSASEFKEKNGSQASIDHAKEDVERHQVDFEGDESARVGDLKRQLKNRHIAMIRYAFILRPL